MKSEAKSNMIKDIILAVLVVGGIATFAIVVQDMPVAGAIIFALVFGGLPFGWKWASNIITATSIIGILIKAILSIILGWVALPFTIIKDIIDFVKAEQ